MVAQASAPRISRRHGQLRVVRDKQRMSNLRGFLRQFILAEGMILSVISVIVFTLLVPQAARARAEQGAMHGHGMHEGMSMPTDSSVDAATQAAVLAWKRESESNHHLAGFLVLAAGLLILA